MELTVGLVNLSPKPKTMAAPSYSKGTLFAVGCLRREPRTKKQVLMGYQETILGFICSQGLGLPR